MPTTDPRHVGVSLGNLDRFVDGLGEFSRQLGLALVRRNAARSASRPRLHLHFHTVPVLRGCFGDEVGYLPVHRAQEWCHRQPTPLHTWHTLNQLNRYPAPAGVTRRLCTVHDLNFLHVKRGYSRWRDLRRLRRLLARQDEVVAISQYVADELRREVPCQAPVQVIHNGASDLRSVPQEPVSGLEGRPFLFHISRMAPSKNVESLLRMAALWPEMPLVLAGPVPARNAQLAAQAAGLGAANVRLVTLPSEGQKAWLYAHCTAFLFPSLAEGFGLPPLEAMHFGKPVFLSTLTSLPEVGGEAAFYWPDFDPLRMLDRLRQGLQCFGTDEAAAAVRHAEHFTWDRAAEAYLELYASLGKPSPPA